MSLRDRLFNATLRSEVVILPCGVEIQIRQLKQSEHDAWARVEASDKPPGYKLAHWINLRCQNTDGTAIFSDADMVAYGSNVACDNQDAVDVIKAIREFDEKTTELHKANLGK